MQLRLERYAVAVLLYACFTTSSYAEVDRATCMVALGVPAGDCDALVALYNSTNGDSWTRKENWGTSTSPWWGVVVSGGRVTVIGIASNNMTGPIPAELGNLSNLDHLLLYQNQLTGPIPAELGNLSILRVLDLAENQLTGAIPAELGNLSNLSVFYIQNNHLDADADGNALIPAVILDWYDGIRHKGISGQTLSPDLLHSRPSCRRGGTKYSGTLHRKS